MTAKQVIDNYRAAYKKMVRDFADSDATPEMVLDCVCVVSGIFAGHQAVQEVGRARKQRGRSHTPPASAPGNALIDAVKQAEDIGTSRAQINSTISAFLYEMGTQGILGAAVLEEAKQYCSKV